jgi:hypothetical protein
LVGGHEKQEKTGARVRNSAPETDALWRTFDSYLLEPSVAQPPLPLQEFFPLQPWSLVLQPPNPLQEFFPAQECFADVAFLDALPVVFWGALSPLIPLAGAATTRATVPPIRPANAAVANTELFETFMVFPSPCA